MTNENKNELREMANRWWKVDIEYYRLFEGLSEYATTIDEALSLIEAGSKLPKDAEGNYVYPGRQMHVVGTCHRTGEKYDGIVWADMTESDEVVIPGDKEFGTFDWSKHASSQEAAERAAEGGGE